MANSITPYTNQPELGAYRPKFKIHTILHIIRSRTINTCSKVHRVFRLAGLNLHLHRYFNFTKYMLETAGKSLRIHAGRNLPDKEFTLP
jgi:hypothetical protein